MGEQVLQLEAIQVDYSNLAALPLDLDPSRSTERSTSFDDTLRRILNPEVPASALTTYEPAPYTDPYNGYSGNDERYSEYQRSTNYTDGYQSTSGYDVSETRTADQTMDDPSAYRSEESGSGSAWNADIVEERDREGAGAPVTDVKNPTEAAEGRESDERIANASTEARAGDGSGAEAGKNDDAASGRATREAGVSAGTEGNDSAPLGIDAFAKSRYANKSVDNATKKVSDLKRKPGESAARVSRKVPVEGLKNQLSPAEIVAKQNNKAALTHADTQSRTQLASDGPARNPGAGLKTAKSFGERNDETGGIADVPGRGYADGSAGSPETNPRETVAIRTGESSDRRQVGTTSKLSGADDRESGEQALRSQNRSDVAGKDQNVLITTQDASADPANRRSAAGGSGSIPGKTVVVDLREALDGATGKDGPKEAADSTESGNDRIGLKSLQPEFSSSRNADSSQGARSFSRVFRETMNPEIVRQSSFVLKGENQGEIRLNLKPEHLGNLRIRLEIVENRITGRIIVDNALVRETVEQNLEDLARAFREQGYDSATLDVSVSGDGNRKTAHKNVPQNVTERRALKEIEEHVPAMEAGYHTIVNVVV